MKQKLLRILCIILPLASVILATALHVRLWPFELLISFTPIAGTLLLAGLVVILIFPFIVPHFRYGKKIMASIAVGMIASLYALTASLMMQPPAAVVEYDGQPLTFITFNKLFSNNDIPRMVNYFKAQNADVISLQETTPQEVARVQQQLGYRHSFTSEKIRTARGTVVGIVSRHPIKSTERIKLTNGPSLIRTVVDIPGSGDMAFYGVHLPGPFNPILYRQRDVSMAAMAEALQKDDLPSVLGGDFNTTIFSPSLRQFNDITRDKLQPTTTGRWPTCSWYGLGSPLCVRIDHVYIPRNAQLMNETIAPSLGSDHRAVVVRFSLSRPKD